MASDRTEHQSGDELKSARDLSLGPRTPPAQIPGYEISGILGAGAYGEVWEAIDQRTGRKVAVKFYTRKGSVDLSLLSREVEKLVFLSADRYVVQLLDVGWEAQPPYYVMDFIENGSLEDELKRRGTLPVNESLELIEEIGIGLMHLHGKGILHCDLKPGNVLLDQDNKPRLADFGQSRLSHELAPALGTLFFMAPEQADLKAAPDARWDVYALGALLYCMLTGHPPFRDDELIEKLESTDGLEDRLTQYRALIDGSPKPTAHRRVPGVDRLLADVIDRAISRNPRNRFPTVQSVIEALRQREYIHHRRPLMLLGLVGPLVLLAIMSLFGWNAWQAAIGQSEQSITVKTVETNHWIAQVAARSASEQINEYFRALRELVESRELQDHLAAVQQGETEVLLQQLRDPEHNTDPKLESVRQTFIASPVRRRLQPPLERNLEDPRLPKAASWFVTDAFGTQVASVFATENISNTIGKNFAWRSYYSGEPAAGSVAEDDEESPGVAAPMNREHIDGFWISEIFQSKATNTWKVALSMPVTRDGEFLGVAAVTAELGSLVEFENEGDQYVMLIDARPGDYQGIVLEHPLLRDYADRGEILPASLSVRRVGADVLQQLAIGEHALPEFSDPVGDDPQGVDFDRRWIASWANVELRVPSAAEESGNPSTGLAVIAVSDRDEAVEPSRKLGRQLAQMGSVALTVFLLISGSLVYLVFRSMGRSRERVIRFAGAATESGTGSARDAETELLMRMPGE